MGASLLGTNGAGTRAAATTFRCEIGGSGIASSGWNTNGETNTRHRFGQAGTLTKLWVFVSANSINTGTTEIRSRINTANGNLLLSIGAGVTGEFEDASGSDTIAAGDLVCLQMVTSGASGTLTTNGKAVVYTPSGTHNCKLFSVSTSGLGLTASLSNYCSVFGENLANTTEANAQYKVRVAGTLRNGYLRVSANSRSDTTTFQTRINGGNGNIVMSVTAAATGDFTDVSNTDAVVDGDLICWVGTTGAGTGTITIRELGLEFDATSGYFEMGCTRPSGVAFNTVTTRYLAPYGTISSDTTEANQQQNSAIPFTASKLRCYLSANTWTLAATLRTRINGANGAQSVSITASTTGWFEDASNSDAIVAGDLINTSILTAGSGSFTIHAVGILGAGSFPQTLSPDPADYDWTAVDPTLTPGSVTLAPDPADYDWTVNDATLTPGSVTLTPDAADYDWTANDATLTAGSVTLTPDPAVFTWTANNPTITAGSVTLTPDAAEFEWVANDAGISVSTDITLYPEPAVWQWYAQSPSIEAQECEPLLGCRQSFFTYSIQAGIQPAPGDDCEVLSGCKQSFFTYQIEG